MKINNGDKFYAIYTATHNNSVALEKFELVNYSIERGVGLFTGVMKLSGFKKVMDFRGHQVGLTKEEAISNYLYETMFHYYLSFFAGMHAKLFAQVFKTMDISMFNKNNPIAINSNIHQLMDYVDLSDIIIEFVEGGIIEPTYNKNRLIEIARIKKYKKLFNYLQNIPEVTSKAIEWNQEEFYPENIKDIFLF